MIRPWPTAPPVEYFGLAGENSEDDARVVLHPVTPHFPGKVIVIVDSSNSSATFQFEQVIQQNHLGLLVGQPTHIELDLPLIGTFPPNEAPDAGLLPNVLVPKTVADVGSGIDREMVIVRQLISATQAAANERVAPRVPQVPAVKLLELAPLKTIPRDTYVFWLP